MVFRVFGFAPGAPSRGPGEDFSGADALAVVEAMRASAPFLAGASVDDYMHSLAQNAERYLGKHVIVEGATVQLRAAVFLESLVSEGLGAYQPEPV